jgi:hypothetical protein
MNGACHTTVGESQTAKWLVRERPADESDGCGRPIFKTLFTKT